MNKTSAALIMLILWIIIPAAWADEEKPAGIYESNLDSNNLSIPAPMGAMPDEAGRKSLQQVMEDEQKRSVELTDRYEKLLERNERQAERYDRILNRWEEQQRDMDTIISYWSSEIDQEKAVNPAPETREKAPGENLDNPDDLE